MASSFRQILRQPDFFRLWIGQIISSIGDRFYQLALLILILGLNSGTQTGKESARILFIGLLPSLLFAPIMGWVVDRFSRKAVLIFSDLVRVVLVLVLTYLWFHSQNLGQVYVIVFGLGAMQSLFILARQAVVPQLVGPGQLVSANGLISLIGVIASLIGTIFAVLLSAVFGYRINFFVTALGFLISSLFLLRIQTSTKPPGLQQNGNWRAHWEDLIEGARYVSAVGLIRWLIGLIALFSFVSGFFAISVLDYVVGHVDLSPVRSGTEWLAHGLATFSPKPPVVDVKLVKLVASGLLLAGLGLGMGLGVLTSGRAKKLMHWKGLSLLAVLLNGIGIVCFALVHHYAEIWFFCVWLGWAGALWMIPLETRLQHEVPDVRRGRVFAVRSVATTVAMMFALACNLSGELLQRLGPNNLIRDLGVGLVVFALLAAWVRRADLTGFWV